MKILFFVLFTLLVITSVWLFMYSVHYLFMIKVFLKNRKRKKNDDTLTIPKHELPKVTIQLPIFNEMFVAERVIKQCAKLDYPKEKLEIQVLDDSTDETLIITKNAVSELSELGYNIKWIHRTNRSGYKGGALKEALAVSEGDFVAVFDADFIPQEDFLQKVIHHFQDEKVALVQCRWTFLNPDYSLLTQVQRIALDGHFLLEQYGRYTSGCFFSFNGSAGIWRKKAIYDGGDWNGDTLTEDLDLSYRVQFKGWKFIFMPDITVNSEIPVLMSGYKSQQFRWAKGFIQCIKKLFKPVIKSNLSLLKKGEALAHLTTHLSYPVILFHLILSLPMIFMFKKFGHLIHNPILLVFFSLTMVIGMSAPLIFSFLSQIAQGKGIFKTIIRLPLLLFINSGLSVHLTKAVWEGIIGKKSGFVRTPKFNINSDNKKLNNDKKYKLKFNFSTVMEIVFALYALVSIILSIKNGIYFTTGFAFIFFVGLSIISLTNIVQELKLKAATSRSRSKKLYHIQWMHPALTSTHSAARVVEKAEV